MLGVKDVANDGQRTSIDLGEQVDALAERMARAKIEDSKLKHNLKIDADEQDVAIREDESTGLQSDLVRLLLQHARALESVALSVSHLRLSLMISY